MPIKSIHPAKVCDRCGGTGLIEVTKHSRNAEGELVHESVSAPCEACKTG